MSDFSQGKRLDFFAYGTLQTGQPLHGWVEDDLFRKCPAVTNGHLYSVGEYPVAFFDETTDIIHGEVLTVNLTQTVVSCIEMELNAGYKARWIDVTFTNGDTQKALALEYTNRNTKMEIIQSGNWIEFAKKREDIQAEFLATALGDMVMGDPQLYNEIVDILMDECDMDNYTENNAIEDLQLMLYSATYVDMFRDYIVQANENLSTTEET